MIGLLYWLVLDAVPYSGIKAPFAPALDLKVGEATAALYSTYFDAMAPTYQTIEGFSDNLQVFSLPAGISKVRIYMWMEGQDVDCENAASGGQAIFNVQLTTEMP